MLVHLELSQCCYVFKRDSYPQGLLLVSRLLWPWRTRSEARCSGLVSPEGLQVAVLTTTSVSYWLILGRLHVVSAYVSKTSHESDASRAGVSKAMLVLTMIASA